MCFCNVKPRQEKNLEIIQNNCCRHLSDEVIKDNLSKNLPFSIRLKLSDEPVSFSDSVFGDLNVKISEGDPIIMKTDGNPTYHLASVIDDNYMKITHVIRGSEWLKSTSKHILLYNAFGWKPPTFIHLPLIMSDKRTKLSKRENDTQLPYLRDNGYYPEALINTVSSVGGGFPDNPNQSIQTINELIENFSIEALQKFNPNLNFDKVKQFNRQTIRYFYKNDRRKLALELNEEYEKHFGKQLSEESFVEKILQWSQVSCFKKLEILNDD